MSDYFYEASPWFSIVSLLTATLMLVLATRLIVGYECETRRFPATLGGYCLLGATPIVIFAGLHLMHLGLDERTAPFALVALWLLFCGMLSWMIYELKVRRIAAWTFFACCLSMCCLSVAAYATSHYTFNPWWAVEAELTNMVAFFALLFSPWVLSRIPHSHD